MGIKYVLITGASRGIGNTVAKRYIDEGAHVIALGKNIVLLEKLDDYARAKGSSITIVKVDLKNLESILKLGEVMAKQFNKLDVLILNAAILGDVAPIEHYDHKIWNEVIAVNLSSNYFLLKALTPLLRNAKSSKVLFVSCSMSREHNAYWGAYAVSKAALEKLAAVYAEENKLSGIKVKIIDPEICYTGISKAAFPGIDEGEIPRYEIDKFVEI